MKLRTRIFNFTDAHGEDINLKRIPVEVYNNGKPTGKTIADLFIGYTDFDGGEIYGQSLLSYYTVAEDGSLVVAGSTVWFIIKDGPVKFISIEEPSVRDDEEISFEDIRKFSNEFNISIPEDVFIHLTQEEKETLKAEREKAARDKAILDKAADDAAAEEARKKKDAEDEAARNKKREEMEEADRNLRAGMKADQVHTEKSMREIRSYYKDKCKEYTAPPFTVFYGTTDEEPCMFIQRGAPSPEAPAIRNWWQEPEQTAFEEGGKIIFEFDDLGKTKELRFNPETGDIKLSDGN